MAKMENNNELIFTEIDDFVRTFDAHKEVQKQNMFEEEEDNTDVWTKIIDPRKEDEQQETSVKVETLDREAPIGKGVSGAYQWLRIRGELKETSERGGVYAGDCDDSKKRKLGVGKDIKLEWRDKYGRTMTPKEAFREFSQRFHGIEPGKKKQEKRMKQYEDELKRKQMIRSEKLLERIKKEQSQSKSPYLVLN